MRPPRTLKTGTSGLNIKKLHKELDKYCDFLMDGKPPVVWYIDEDPKSEWNEFAMEPKRFNVICAAPGVGKTAFVHQLIFKAMQVNKDLRVLELNCDIPLDTVLGRELSRRSRLSPDTIRFKGFVRFGIDKINAIALNIDDLFIAVDVENFQSHNRSFLSSNLVHGIGKATICHIDDLSVFPLTNADDLVADLDLSGWYTSND